MKHLITLFLLVLSNSAFAGVDNDKTDRIVMRQNTTQVENSTEQTASRDIANQSDTTTPNSTRRIHRTGYISGL